jgi:hypothetical protein
MTTPSGLISLDDIFIEANPGWTSSESFGRVAYESWAQGPLGSNTYASNGWGGDGSGGGVPIGGNAIYNSGAPFERGVDFINMGNYSNRTYYFDGTTYDIQFSWSNPLTNSMPPPPAPPIINNVDVQIVCKDYNMIYNVHNPGSINATAPSSSGPVSLPGGVTNFPLVESVYWEITVTTNFNNTISNIAFQINGTTVINVGSGGGIFTWQSTGASKGYTGGSGILYTIDVT